MEFGHKVLTWSAAKQTCAYFPLLPVLCSPIFCTHSITNNVLKVHHRPRRIKTIAVSPSSGEKAVGELDDAAGVCVDVPDDWSGRLETRVIGCDDDLTDGLDQLTATRALGVDVSRSFVFRQHQRCPWVFCTTYTHDFSARLCNFCALNPSTALLFLRTRIALGVKNK